ncbi:NAD(P)-dependent oxidoreductase [Propionimicrobium sp. PCR01-08-3]|uniref:NAD(P)-dependent oxidoreductase n=1 Tax=Propionimicrobium sp. PCR01-08-3 TaxID=3052086 RepID=UPI00255C82B3|nr:NAD(P)-dependent oxidoreductase [Propionimicrobium sp. PCR01-08-3]WIY83544.1 NAD(P)-dependent oxidoreductase [Propionimicrobium sp. PCR01-08-3]
MPIRRVVLLFPNPMSVEQFPRLAPRLAPRFAEHRPELRLVDLGGNVLDDGGLVDPLDVVGIMAPPASPIDAATMDRYPDLRVISTPSVGQDHIDVDAARARGIAVGNAKGYNADEVAEYALTAILTLAKDLPRATADTRAHAWDVGRTHMRMLSETTVGLAGFGEVARRMVPMLVGLGMRVVVWNRSDVSRYPEAADVSSLPTIEEVARQTDVLSLHVALTDQTRHLVDSDLLAQMKPDSAIVNTGRGGLVDTAALRQAVESGSCAGPSSTSWPMSRRTGEPSPPPTSPRSRSPRTWPGCPMGRATAASTPLPRRSSTPRLPRPVHPMAETDRVVGQRDTLGLQLPDRGRIRPDVGKALGEDPARILGVRPGQHQRPALELDAGQP